MATYVPPKRATALKFSMSLFARSDNQIKTAPTLAAGDVKVSKDFGATANITTLPSEAPASSGILTVDLSATEMTADIVTVIFRDAAGAEWNDVAVHIPTAARQIDDLAYPTTSGRAIDVSAGGEVGLDWANIGSPTTAVNLSGTNIDVDQVVASVSGAVASVTGAVGSVTGNVGGTINGLTAVALKDFFDTDSTTTYASAVAGSVVKEIADNAGGASLTAAEIADAVWDEAQADHVAVGSFGITASEIADILVDTAEIGAAGAGLTNINLPNQTMDIVGSITGSLSGSVGSVTGNVSGSVASIAASGITSSSFATGAITAASISADAIGASELSTGAVTEITDAVWAAAARTLTALDEDSPTIDINGAIEAGVATALATYDPPTRAELTTDINSVLTPLGVVDGIVDDILLDTADIGAIKAKTDSLTFTVAGKADANIEAVNGAAIDGVGSEADPWGPA
jgi:hypothetical protein